MLTVFYLGLSYSQNWLLIIKGEEEMLPQMASPGLLVDGDHKSCSVNGLYSLTSYIHTYTANKNAFIAVAAMLSTWWEFIAFLRLHRGVHVFWSWLYM
jgi:hypothetical protein